MKTKFENDETDVLLALIQELLVGRDAKLWHCVMGWLHKRHGTHRCDMAKHHLGPKVRDMLFPE